jgi:hypothetical protein
MFENIRLGLWSLTALSTIFDLYRGEKTTDVRKSLCDKFVVSLGYIVESGVKHHSPLASNTQNN